MTAVLHPDSSPPGRAVVVPGGARQDVRPDPAGGAALPLAARAAAAAWSALSGRLAGVPRMRVSRDGGLTYPARYEQALHQANPGVAATVPVFNAEAGTGQLLAFDFDVKLAAAAGSADPSAAVAAEAAVLTGLVARLGGRSITDVSPPGGRHVYVLLARPMPWRELRDLVRAASLRYSSLDWASTMSRPSAQVCPPGARHKSGGWRELTVPLAEAARAAWSPCGPAQWNGLLAEFAGELAAVAPASEPGAGPAGTVTGDDGEAWLPRPGGRVPLSVAIESIARTGTWPAGRYDSRSEARMAVITAAAAAGWRLAEVRAQVAAGTWRGLALLYASARERRRLQRLMPAEWSSAVADLAEAAQRGVALRDLRPGQTAGSRERAQHVGDPPGEESARNWHTSRDTHAPRGATPEVRNRNPGEAASERGWIRQWVTAADLAARGPDAAERWGRHAISVRLVLTALGQAAIVSGSRVVEFGVRNLALQAAVSHRTAARVLELLREEDHDHALVEQVSRGRLKRADRYELRIPPALEDAAAWRRRRAGWIEAVHPAFTVLGGPAALVYAALSGDEVPGAEAARAAAIGDTAAADALRLLAEHGLAEHGQHGWKRGPASLDAVAEVTGAAELHSEREARYRKEREAWQALVDSWTAPPYGHVPEDTTAWVPSAEDILPEHLEEPAWYTDDHGPPLHPGPQEDSRALPRRG